MIFLGYDGGARVNPPSLLRCRKWGTIAGASSTASSTLGAFCTGDGFKERLLSWDRARLEADRVLGIVFDMLLGAKEIWDFKPISGEEQDSKR